MAAVREGVGFKILLSLLLLIFVLAATIYWFNYIGLINIQQTWYKFTKKIPGLKVAKEIQDPFLLEKEYFEKLKLSYDSKFLELQRKEEDLNKKIEEFKSKEELLNKKEKALEEREETIKRKQKQFEDYKMTIRKQAEYFMGMPPQKAVEIMNNMKISLVLDILRMMDQIAEERGEDSLVPYYLSLMPKDRAAKLNEYLAAGATTYPED